LSQPTGQRKISVLHQQDESEVWLRFLHGQYTCGNNDEYAIERQLSRGLAYLRGLIHTRSIEECQLLLEDEGSLVPKYGFLGSKLGGASYGDDQLLADIQPDEENDYTIHSLLRDMDSGPEDAWRWAHAAQSADDWVFSDRQSPLRRWGYVMWDRERLDAWGVLEHAWCPKDLDPIIAVMADADRTECERAAIANMMLALDALDD
jgi:hypothetical protein